MSFFAGGGGSKVKPQYTGIQLQTSSSTQAITLLWGMNRIAPNIFYYSDFQSHKQKQKAGKGFGGSATSYTYSASIMLGLCQGPISGIDRVFRDQDKTTDYTTLGFSLFTGEVGQAPWGYLLSSHPDEAFSYSSVAYVAAANYDLGASASTPQHSFEVRGLRYNTGPLSNGDADCSLVVQDLLTHGEFGAGFAPETMDMTQLLSSGAATTTGDGAYQTYCRARGFGLNPALSSQESAGNILDRWTELTDTAVVWTGYSLKLIPYGTEIVEGNGYKFVPNVTAIYNLSDNDYIVESGNAPVSVSRSDPSDANNSVKLNVRNRDNEYNDAPVEWKDQGLIDTYGLRQGNTIDAAEICSLDMGSLIVSLVGQRLAYSRNTYDFTLPSTFCLMEPMDILIVTDPQMGDVAVWIEDLEEQDDYSWKVTAKEIPPGIAKAASSQPISNTPINTSSNPGPVNVPLIFQPPLDMTGGLPQIWSGVSGGDGINFNPLWGGAFVYVSTDGISYTQIGQADVPARQGKLTSTLDAFSGSNPDTVHEINVSLAMSGGDLQSVSSDEASREATISYVDGELIGFEVATLQGAYQYELTRLYRGLHGTLPSLHSTGSSFVRLDNAIFKYDLPDSYIGLQLYFKFQSFNIWGGGVQDLADCQEYTYTPQGSIPIAPSGLTLSGGGTTWTGNYPAVACDAVSGATNYSFQFRDPTTLALIREVVSPVPTASYSASQASIDGLLRSYAITVSSVGTYGTSVPSSPIVVTNDAPAILTGVSASGGAGSGYVAFDASGDPDAAGYLTKYSTSSGFDPATSGSLAETSYSPQVLSPLAAGTYYAKVACYDNWSKDAAFLSFSTEVSFIVT